MTQNASPLQDTVAVTGDALVLSLMSAQSPTVWRMDLTQARSSALSVEDNGTAGASLVLVTLSGQRTVVAQFDSRDKTMAVLASVTRALAGKPGKKTAAAPEGARAPVRWGRLLAIIVGVAVLGWVALTVSMMIFGPPPSGGDPNIGVSRSADDFLSGQ